jgi:hypothetical protein
MSEKCFYCTNEMDAREIHYVSFVSADEERDELLCDECYREWLHGLNG